MTGMHLVPIPAPANADDGQEYYAVLTHAGYAGRVESQACAEEQSDTPHRWAAYGPDGARIGRWFTSRASAAATLGDRGRIRGPVAEDVSRPHTALYVTDAELATLRSLAAALGLYTRRGPHAGERGSVTALAAVLARAAECNQPLVVAVMRGLIAASEDAP
jgi:hypothetical protein